MNPAFRSAGHWVVATSAYEVTVNDDVILVHENESTYLPIGYEHRLYRTRKLRA